MVDGDIVEIYVAASEADAQQLKDLLEREGIQATIVGQPLQSALGELPLGWSTAVRLWVARADAQRAAVIVDKWELDSRSGQSTSSALPWTCSHCGEEVPGEFDICWNCQTAREQRQL